MVATPEREKSLASGPPSAQLCEHMCNPAHVQIANIHTGGNCLLSPPPPSPLSNYSSAVTWPVVGVSCNSHSESARLAAHRDNMITLSIITVRS